ncbi:GTPase Era [bacterium]|nr:GTPase Era [bacterium]
MVKAGTVGLIGLPNSGKSTFSNVVVGEKFSIVSPKPQTTRNKVLGIRTYKDNQFIFIDAPGKVKPNTDLNEYLEKEFQLVVDSSDFLLLFLNIDAKRFEDLEELILMASKIKKPVMALITKKDLKLENRICRLMNTLEKHEIPYKEISCKPISFEADLLLEEMSRFLPYSDDFLYDKDMYTTQTMRDMSSEIIREQCFLNFKQEVPYGLAVDIKKYEEGGALDKIYAKIIVSRENHLPIIVGKGGSSIKRIGEASRKEIEKVADKKVFLDLHVAVRKNWQKSKIHMKNLGYHNENR